MSDDFVEPNEPTIEEELAYYKRERSRLVDELSAANSRLEEARTEIEKLKDHDIDSQTRHMLNILLSRLSTSRETERKTDEHV